MLAVENGHCKMERLHVTGRESTGVQERVGQVGVAGDGRGVGELGGEPAGDSASQAMAADLENWPARQMWRAVVELHRKKGFAGGKDVIKAYFQRVFESF